MLIAKIVHDATEFLALFFIENLFHAGLAFGADFVHLGLDHLVVHGEIVEDGFNFGRLVRGKLKLFLEAVEGDLFIRIVPGDRFDGLGGGAIN